MIPGRNIPLELYLLLILLPYKSKEKRNDNCAKDGEFAMKNWQKVTKVKKEAKKEKKGLAKWRGMWYYTRAPSETRKNDF